MPFYFPISICYFCFSKLTKIALNNVTDGSLCIRLDVTFRYIHNWIPCSVEHCSYLFLKTCIGFGLCDIIFHITLLLSPQCFPQGFVFWFFSLSLPPKCWHFCRQSMGLRDATHTKTELYPCHLSPPTLPPWTCLLPSLAWLLQQPNGWGPLLSMIKEWPEYPLSKESQTMSLVGSTTHRPRDFLQVFDQIASSWWRAPSLSP